MCWGWANISCGSSWYRKPIGWCYFPGSAITSWSPCCNFPQMEECSRGRSREGCMDSVDQYCREAAAAVHFLNTRRRAGEATRPSFTTMMQCQIASSVPPLEVTLLVTNSYISSKALPFCFVTIRNLIPNTYKDKVYIILSITSALTANTHSCRGWKLWHCILSCISKLA